MPVINCQFVLDLAPKQLEIMRLCQERGRGRKILFVNGPKFTGKTTGCLAAVADHAWNIQDARINIIVPTITSGDDSGVWSELTEKIIPDWIAGEFGMDWWVPRTGKKILGPRQKGTSKKLYFDIRNKHGGKSHIELNSLNDVENTEQQIEGQFFNRYFTMVYWGELQNFSRRHSLTTLLSTLRMVGRSDDDFVMLLDGNPGEQGEDAWQHKLFYQMRLARDLSDEERTLQKSLQVLEVWLDDNPYLTEARKQQIRSDYSHDSDLYDRYILGLWKKATTNALFNSVFKPSIHVIGNTNDADPEMLLPSEDCIELISGWDPGGANPAAVICEKVFRTVEVPATNEKPATTREESVFKWIDELAFVKEDFSIGEFTELFIGLMDFWEKFLGRVVMWKHWADRSAFDTKDAISKQFVYQEIYAASAKRILIQQAIDQGPGTVGKGIRLWRKLLFQERMYFSAGKTPKLIAMNQGLKRDRRRGVPPDSVAKGQNERHIFDSARYCCMRECWEEIQSDILHLETSSKPEPKIISAPI